MSQTLSGRGCCTRLSELLEKQGIRKFLLVKDAAFDFLPCAKELNALPHVDFSDFTINPQYEDVCKGVALFRQSGCDAIVAIGGGSSMDVAKCIKLFAKMCDAECYLNQPFEDSGIPLLAIPTTAGTGSEATRFAVLYYKGEKQSISHPSIIPDFALLDADMLNTLPLFQKKCTMLDALCQGIESWWSINANEESIAYSRKAIKPIWQSMDAYLEGDQKAAEVVLKASHEAGKAINLTQTTAAHAMSYKITSMFHLPHGYAVALCLPKVWRYMLAHLDQCKGDQAELTCCFARIAAELGAESPEAAIDIFEQRLTRLGITPPEQATLEQAQVLAHTINPVRLKNNPVEILPQDTVALYLKVLHLK